MAIKLVSRKAWGARASKGAATLAGTRGVKVHYTGSLESPKMRDDHDLCAPRVRQIQRDHMDNRDWNDIAYSYLACVHGYVFEGRGVHILPAANGAGLNAGHYAVCALIGNAGLIHPSAALYDAICDAITLVRDTGNAGREVLGHRDGYSTDCPGDLLYTWVEAGAPCKGADNEGGGAGDMPSHVKVTLGKAMPAPADTWSTVWWHAESHDPDHQHADAGGPSVLNGPALYGLAASLVLSGMPAGTEYQMRAVEVDRDGKEADTLGPVGEGLASSGDTYALYSLGAGRVLEGRRVRVQVKPLGHPATITAGACELTFWR